MAKVRGRESVRDLVLSMAVLVAVSVVIYLLFIPRDDSKDPVQPVTYAVEAQQARRDAPYAVATPPEGSPEGWRATSVRYKDESNYGASWHLGFVTPDDEYVGVEQANQKLAAFIGDVTQGARATKRVESVNGEDWVRYEGAKRDALVREEPEGTTVVTGTAGFAQLKEMAAALEFEKSN